MLCRNCNHNLSGEEDFCPHCGVPQKLTDVSSSTAEKSQEEERLPSGEQKSSIFQTEPVYIYTDPPKEKEKKKPKAAVAFVSLFIVTLLIIGVLTLGEYFQLTPAFSELFQLSASQPETTAPEVVVSDEYDSSLGTVAPDINFRSALCTVTSEKGLPLRKGPDNAYAVIDAIAYGTNLQVIGKSLDNDLWGYVYIPSMDIYGWLLCSYLAEASALSAPETTKTTTEEKPVTQSKPVSDKTPEETAQYFATVTAEKGLYLRIGPGVNYEAISVIPHGKTVTVIKKHKEDSSWLLVSVDDVTGYMNKAYLTEKSV